MGRTAAVMFAREGARIIANDYAAGPLEETVSMVREQGGTILSMPGNVAVAGDVERAIAEVLADGGTRTPDLGGNAGTSDLGAAIVAAIS